MKVASSVTWDGAVPFPVIPHSLLWGALLLKGYALSLSHERIHTKYVTLPHEHRHLTAPIDNDSIIVIG